MKDNFRSDLYLLAWQRVKELTIKELLCFARSREVEVRNLIIMEFHLRSGREVFEIALSLIHEKNHKKKAISREVGYLILGQLGTPDRPFREESMPVILEGMDSEKLPSVRCAIACAIGHLVPPKIYHERIIEGFMRFLDEDNRRSLQVEIAFGIGGLSMSSQLEKLVERLLLDADDDIQEWIEISLEAINVRNIQEAYDGYVHNNCPDNPPKDRCRWLEGNKGGFSHEAVRVTKEAWRCRPSRMNKPARLG